MIRDTLQRAFQAVAPPHPRTHREFRSLAIHCMEVSTYPPGPALESTPTSPASTPPAAEGVAQLSRSESTLTPALNLRLSLARRIILALSDASEFPSLSAQPPPRESFFRSTDDDRRLTWAWYSFLRSSSQTTTPRRWLPLFRSGKLFLPLLPFPVRRTHATLVHPPALRSHRSSSRSLSSSGFPTTSHATNLSELASFSSVFASRSRFPVSPLSARGNPAATVAPPHDRQYD